MLKSTLVSLACTLPMVVMAAASSSALHVSELPQLEPDLRRYLIEYRNDGLKLHALLVRPASVAARTPLPVVVASHGFHPDPPKYGFIDATRNERPGAYYREVPRAFARRGFAVVMADYRGHNTSEGVSFTLHPESPDYYASDVVALIQSLTAVPGLRLRCLNLWGHSMGSHVALAVALAVPGINAISLWSLASPRADWSSTLPGDHHLPPIVIRHSIRDSVATVEQSRRLESALRSGNHPFEAAYEDSADHFFSGALFSGAVDADVAFFLRAGSSGACRRIQ